MQNYHHIILPVIQLMVYNRTIARYIADSKVVCQRLRQATRFSLDNSWARRRLKHLSWISRWIIVCTLERGMPVSRKISRADRCLFGLSSSWMSTVNPPLYAECGLQLTGCRTIVAYPSRGFSSADYRCFQVSSPCRKFHATAFVHHTHLTDRDFF